MKDLLSTNQAWSSMTMSDADQLHPLAPPTSSSPIHQLKQPPPSTGSIHQHQKMLQSVGTPVMVRIH